MHTSPDKRAILEDRASMLKQARSFFDQRHILEVDCPILTQGASVDAHIDLIPASCYSQEIRYLHSSPEYGMKRLLADGMGDIYQISHVFRDGESSPKHNPEFMMAEWYRLGITFETMIHETLDFIRLFLGSLPSKILSYREAFQKYTGLDYIKATFQDLMQFLQNHDIEPYKGIETEGKDALLNIILGTFVEPFLGKNELCVLAYYPASQAALAKTLRHEEEHVAERYEIYYQGIELANGYHELTHAAEQRKRLIEANHFRKILNKTPLPLDEHFLAALEKGLPDVCGVAVGFDRLMMLRHQTSQISDVIPFVWNKA